MLNKFVKEVRSALFDSLITYTYFNFKLYNDSEIKVIF